MIDLTTKDLPKTIDVNGKSILLNTDFRVWIKLWHEIDEHQHANIGSVILDSPQLDAEDIPTLRDELTRFMLNPNVTPNYRGKGGVKSFDYYYDGEYIYSAFMRIYGIDLLTSDMHWHVFKSLCDDIRDDDTIFGHAKSARAWKKPTKQETEDRYYKKEKEAWSFPHIETEEEMKEKEKKYSEFEEYFKDLR